MFFHSWSFAMSTYFIVYKKVRKYQWVNFNSNNVPRLREITTCPPPPHTCSNSSHSWLADGPFTMSDKAVACLAFEVVTSTPWLFVSSVKTVLRNCRATVWRRGSAVFSFTHTDNVPADTQGNEWHSSTHWIMVRQQIHCSDPLTARYLSVTEAVCTDGGHTNHLNVYADTHKHTINIYKHRHKYTKAQRFSIHLLLESSDFLVALLITEEDE